MGNGGDTLFLHAACVAIGSHGVLLIGEPGSGKSDLALRLIDRGAMLVSDDQVVLTRKGGVLIASAPLSIAGLLEIRGLGIFHMQHQDDVPLSMAVRLTEKGLIERLPEPEFYECMGIGIPQVRLAPFEASSPVKIEMVMAAAQQKEEDSAE